MNLVESKSYWDTHPIGAEVFDSEVGSKDFYDHYLNYYDQFYDYKHRVFQYEKYTGKKVLEIGCGLGIDTIKWAKAGADITAIDLSDTSVRCTRNLFRYHELEGDIRQGNAERLEFTDESFDVVYAYGVLMHVADEEAMVDEIYRVLTPGGTALVVVYNRWSWYWLLVKLSGAAVESEEGDPSQNRVYSRADVRRIFHRFSSLKISCERPPRKTRRRGGVTAIAFNNVFIPLYQAVPLTLTKNFGWHLIIKAIK